MKVFELNAALQNFRNAVPENKVVGLVPTMGALHEGHLSLIDIAAAESDIVIVSIFVNPNQFNDPEDLKNYPRNLKKDLHLLSSKKIDAVFVPDVHQIYPKPATREFDFGKLDKILEGKHRPGHFNGVAQVVSRLFEIINPDKAFFGQKDFQQLTIIKELVRQLDLKIEIVSCPIIREPDGLAMSSRNQLLEPEEREHAAAISQTLFRAREMKNKMDPGEIENWAINILNNDPLIKVEYFKIINTEDLSDIKSWSDPAEKIACVAVKIGKIRLIDNLIFE